MVYVYLWQDFRLNRIGFVTASRVNVAFLFEVTLPQFQSLFHYVVTFQFSNFTKNATSGMTNSISSIMTVSVIESTRVNVIFKVIVTVSSKMFSADRFSKHCHCRK